MSKVCGVRSSASGLAAALGLILALVACGGACRRESSDPAAAPTGPASTPSAPAAAQTAPPTPGTAPAAVPPGTARLELAFLSARQGQPLPRAQVKAGGRLVLGGFVRGLNQDAVGKTSFVLTFEARAGERKLSQFHNTVRTPLDLPAEGGLRLDFGAQVPDDVPPGKGVWHLELAEPGRPPLVRDYEFEILPKG